MPLSIHGDVPNYLMTPYLPNFDAQEQRSAPTTTMQIYRIKPNSAYDKIRLLLLAGALTSPVDCGVLPVRIPP